MSKTAEQAIRQYMDQVFTSHIDDCGALNLIGLAEDCAYALGHDEWLDDEGNYVWEYPVTLARTYNLFPQ